MLVCCSVPCLPECLCLGWHFFFFILVPSFDRYLPLGDHALIAVVSMSQMVNKTMRKNADKFSLLACKYLIFSEDDSTSQTHKTTLGKVFFICLNALISHMNHVWSTEVCIFFLLGAIMTSDYVNCPLRTWNLNKICGRVNSVVAGCTSLSAPSPLASSLSADSHSLELTKKARGEHEHGRKSSKMLL